VTQAADDRPFGAARARHRPGPRPGVLVAVLIGGVAGGAARYAVTAAWPTPDRGFPWSTLVVNGSGAFLLPLLLVLSIDLGRGDRFLRPMLGTGFCGAYTTFSSIVVGTDQLMAHRHPGTAVAYLLASLAAGLAAAGLGFIAGRWIAGRRPHVREMGAA